MYVYVYVCICMYMYVYVCICMHMYVYVCICLYMSVYVCICMFMYVYVCICRHTLWSAGKRTIRKKPTGGKSAPRTPALEQMCTALNWPRAPIQKSSYGLIEPTQRRAPTQTSSYGLDASNSFPTSLMLSCPDADGKLDDAAVEAAIGAATTGAISSMDFTAS